MTVPSRWVQLYQNYDHSFVDKVRTLKFHTTDDKGVDSEKPLLCVFATPERAFAQVARQIARRRNLPKEEEDVILKNIPLPIASISRGIGKFDHERYVRCYLQKCAYDLKLNKLVGTQRPLPYTFPFQVDLWSRELQTLDDLTVQAMIWLRANEFWMTVKHPEPIGDVNVLCLFDNIVDNSVLESETEQRTLRRTLNYNVFGWLVYDPEYYGFVEKITIEHYDLETEEFWESYEVTE